MKPELYPPEPFMQHSKNPFMLALAIAIHGESHESHESHRYGTGLSWSIPRHPGSVPAGTRC